MGKTVRMVRVVEFEGWEVRPTANGYLRLLCPNGDIAADTEAGLFTTTKEFDGSCDSIPMEAIQMLVDEWATSRGKDGG